MGGHHCDQCACERHADAKDSRNALNSDARHDVIACTHVPPLAERVERMEYTTPVNTRICVRMEDARRIAEGHVAKGQKLRRLRTWRLTLPSVVGYYCGSGIGVVN